MDVTQLRFPAWFQPNADVPVVQVWELPAGMEVYVRSLPGQVFALQPIVEVVALAKLPVVEWIQDSLIDKVVDIPVDARGESRGGRRSSRT